MFIAMNRFRIAPGSEQAFEDVWRNRPSSRARRHDSSGVREMPCRRAVADTCRCPASLSSTIRSFSAADHRRRRPVSTISGREKTALSLWAHIRTVCTDSPDQRTAAPPEGYHEAASPRI